MSGAPARLLPALLAIAWVACSGGGEAGPPPSVVFAAAVSTGCDALPAPGHVLPADAQWFVLRALDGDGNEVHATAFGRDRVDEAGQALVTGVPPGTWRLDLTACDGDGRARWWGAAPDTTVAADGKASPLFWMVHAGDLTCLGGTNVNPLVPGFLGDGFLSEGATAFGAAAVSPAGRVVLAGGATEYAADRAHLVAGDRVWELDPYAGVFQRVRVGDAAVAAGGPRMLHAMAFLDEDRLVLAGGATAATLLPYKKQTSDDYSLFPGKRAPVVPEQAPAAAVTLVRLSDGQATPLDGVAAPGLLPAVALDGRAGRVALVGGLGPGEVPVGGAVIADLAGGAPVTVAAGARFGGTATFLSTGQVLVVGGRSPTGAALPELIDPAAGAVTSLDRPAVDTAFPSVAVLLDDGAKARVLVAGGNVVTGFFDYNNPDQPSFWVLELSGEAGGYAPASATLTELDLGAGDWPLRSLGALVPWTGAGDLLWLGGYRQNLKTLETVPACQGSPQPHCLPPALQALVVDGAAVTATDFAQDGDGRLGPATVRLGPGRVLVHGGLPALRPPLNTRPLSTSVIAFAGGPVFDDVCARHPVPGL